MFTAQTATDVTVTKLAIDHKLQMEEENVKWLQEKMTKSTELKSEMVSILNSFEERLSKLEATILPVYQETGNLRRRQENIDKTLEALDHVMGFYNVSKDVEPILKAGPMNGDPGSLERYLQTMSRLKGALDYFEKHNPQSIELENVRSRYELGGDALGREFSEQVKKHSKPVTPIDLLNAISGFGQQPDRAEDLASIQYFPEDVQNDLMAIAEWLSLNDHDEFMNIYAAVRGSLMKKSLDLLREHQRTMSVGSPGRKSPPLSKKYLTPGVDGTPNTVAKHQKISKINSSINKHLTNVTNRIEAVTRRSSGLPAYVAEDMFSEPEAESFCVLVAALQQLMASERGLMIGIVPYQYQKKIFEIITRESMNEVVREGVDNVIGKVRKTSASNDYLNALAIFFVIRHLFGLHPAMERTLEGCEPSIRTKYHEMVHKFYATGATVLDGFIDAIRGDTTTKDKMPRDGTVFQLTSNVILFLEQLLEYSDTVSTVLTTQDTTYNQMLLRSPRKISVHERSSALLGLYVRKVLVQLNVTLVNKSESYADQFLKAIFRLNNYQYILTSLQRSNLLEVVSLIEPACEENYNDMILDQKRLYSQSWAKVIIHIWPQSEEIPLAILRSPDKLSDRYCRIIKEKFAGFNKEFEEIAKTQRSYSLPDVELRESLKRDNKEYICPKYNSFYERYANVLFTKYPQKYVRYTPAEVSNTIDSFFDASA